MSLELKGKKRLLSHLVYLLLAIVWRACLGNAFQMASVSWPSTNTNTNAGAPSIGKTASLQRMAVSDTDNDDETKDNLQGLLKKLDQTFDYEGRMEARTEQDFRCGFVVIIGAPNMGKSTLMNALLQEELCITTPRPQTTRHAILGLLSTPSSQVCLVDTPGVIEQPAYKLQQGMMEAVLGAFYDADVLMVVTDVYSTPIPSDTLFARVQQSSKPVVVVINKIDLLHEPQPTQSASNKGQKEGGGKNSNSDDDGDDEDDYGVPEFDRTTTVEEAVARWRQLLPNALAIIPVAASQGPEQVGVQAVAHLLMAHPKLDASFRNLGRPIPGMFRDPTKFFLTQEEVAPLLPVSPPLYDTEILTDRPERFIASEIIRAALFETLRKEVPYCCEVRLQSFKEQPADDSLRLEATIVVERDSQKAIVIGKGGSTVKHIRVKAQKALEDFFQAKVALFLTVAVDKDWRKNEKRLAEYGYMKPKKKKTKDKK